MGDSTDVGEYGPSDSGSGRAGMPDVAPLLLLLWWPWWACGPLPPLPPSMLTLVPAEPHDGEAGFSAAACKKLHFAPSAQAPLALNRAHSFVLVAFAAAGTGAPEGAAGSAAGASVQSVARLASALGMGSEQASPDGSSSRWSRSVSDGSCRHGAGSAAGAALAAAMLKGERGGAPAASGSCRGVAHQAQTRAARPPRRGRPIARAISPGRSAGLAPIRAGLGRVARRRGGFFLSGAI